MNTFFKGLNPLSSETGCYHYLSANGTPEVLSLVVGIQPPVALVEKEDLPLSAVISNTCEKELGLIGCFVLTYRAMVGHHDSFNIYPEKFPMGAKTEPTFKGILDFLVLPLIARRLWNWSFLEMQKDTNGFVTEMAISAARTVSLAISAVRVLMGAVLTLVLSPAILVAYFYQADLKNAFDLTNSNTDMTPIEDESLGAVNGNNSPNVI